MQEQFRCEILVDLPVERVQTGERVSFRIAELGFDPGIQSESEITVTDAGFARVMSGTGPDAKKIRGVMPRFNFRARVLKRERVLAVDSVKDSNGEVASRFTLCIYLEIADKEQMPEIIKAVTGDQSVYRPIPPTNQPE